MLKLVFTSIIGLFLVGSVFLVGFVLGSTMTPLPPAEPPSPSSSAPEVVDHG